MRRSTEARCGPGGDVAEEDAPPEIDPAHGTTFDGDHGGRKMEKDPFCLAGDLLAVREGDLRLHH